MAATGISATVVGCDGDDPSNAFLSRVAERYGAASGDAGITTFPPLPVEIAANIGDIIPAFPPGDVRRYGAVADGIADDSMAIQNAFRVAAFAGIWCVTLPRGIYRIRTPITDEARPAGSKLLVRGDLSVVLIDTPGGEFLKLMSSDVQISGLIIDSSPSVSGEVFSAAILIQDASDITIDMCAFESIANVGIRVLGQQSGCGNIRVSGCNFKHARGSTILASTESENSRVERLMVRDCEFLAPSAPLHNQTRAVHLASGTHDCIISNNTLRGSATADYLSGWRDAIMVGNDSDINKPSGILISGNSITGMADDGIGLAGASQVSIQGNIIFGSLLTAGIYCPATSTWTNKNVSIVGNTLFNHLLAGIYLKDTATYLITGNEIHDCADGIVINDSTATDDAVEGGIVSSNFIHRVSKCGILCDSGHLIANSNSISHFGSGPQVTETRRAGIFLSALKPGSSITGNTINDGRHGILLTGGMGEFVIANNCCTNVPGYGIYFIDFAGEDWIISANRIGGGVGQAANLPHIDERKVWTSNI